MRASIARLDLMAENVNPSPTYNPALKYLCLCGLALPWLNPYTAGPTPNAWPWLISAYCAVILSMYGRRLNFKFVVAALIFSAAVSALIGLLQYFGVAHFFDPWVSQTGPGEAFANLRQRNQFATLTSIGLLAMIGWLSGWRNSEAQTRPWWASCLVLLLAAGNTASSSRTGLLQWIVILLLTALWTLPKRRRVFVLALQAVMAYLIAALALPRVLAVTTNIASEGVFGRLVDAPGCESRSLLWSNVLSLIAQKPWLGWGWGELDYAHFINLYSGPRFCQILDNAHNLPLHLAVELGVPAALALCGAAIWAVWRGKPWRETDPARQMAWGVLAVILLHSMLEYPLWYGPFQIAVGLCLYLLFVDRSQAAAGDAPVSGKKPDMIQRMGRGMLVLCMAVLVVLMYAGFDYYKVTQIYLAPEQRNAAYREDTLNKIRGTLFFRDQLQFAELSVTPLTRSNAQWTYDTATALLHYSPEPSVIEKVIESAVMLGRDQEALAYLVRYRAAFPREHARWAKAQQRTAEGLKYLE